jgi:hypothetical protein
MTDERDLSIRIKRTSSKRTGSILDELFASQKFPGDDECMFENNSRVSFERVPKRNPIVEQNEPEEDENEDYLTFSQTLKPVMHDVTGTLEQRGQLNIERHEQKNTVTWVIQVDNRRARFLDRIIEDFIARLKRTFSMRGE